MSWNCGRGFLRQHKITEAAHFIKSMDISICAVSEADIRNHNEYSGSQYNIPQYFPVFPKSWNNLKIARIITYCKNELRNNIKIREDLMTENQPDIWLQIQIGKGTKFLLGMIYREWTSTDGKGSHKDQKDRLQELINNAEKARFQTDFESVGSDFIRIRFRTVFQSRDPCSLLIQIHACSGPSKYEENQQRQI